MRLIKLMRPPREHYGGSVGRKRVKLYHSSLVPRPPPFFVLQFSFSIEAEEHKKRGRPGNTYHVNDVWWT